MWRRKRLAVYVTLLENSTLAEWYVVVEQDGGGSDLVNEGFSDSSKVPLAIALALMPLLDARTAEPSRS